MALDYHFDFDAAVQAPFRMQPGLRRLAKGTRHTNVSRRDSPHLREKLNVLSREPDSALQCASGFDARPALHALATQAALEHSDSFRWDGKRAMALELGWAVEGETLLESAERGAPLPEVGACLRSVPAPSRLAALLALALAEDIAVVDGHKGRIPWLAVALPSHWVPRDKVGRHFAEVHAPVADNRMLLAAADGLARLVSAPTRWERFVWTITPHPQLDAHPVRWPDVRWTPGHADAVAAQAHWRTERQTFIPVEGTGQAVFTIHVECQSLTTALHAPDKAMRVHDALASMSEAVLRYRGLSGVRDPLLEWLARRAGR